MDIYFIHTSDPMSQINTTTETTGGSQRPSPDDERETDVSTKDILKQISSKLSIVIFSLNTLNEHFEDFKEQLSEKSSVTPDANLGTLGGTLEQIKEVLEKVSLPGNETTTNHPPETYQIHTEEYALKIKNKISKIWENSLRSRRLLYWQALRNKNIAATYEEWLQEDTIILPQWVQM